MDYINENIIKILSDGYTDTEDLDSPQTLEEIQNKLTQLEFPIVIQDEDEISPILYVNGDNYSQFNGLEKQMWPFVKAWYEESIDLSILKKVLPKVKRKNIESYLKKLQFPITVPDEDIRPNKDTLPDAGIVPFIFEELEFNKVEFKTLYKSIYTEISQKCKLAPVSSKYNDTRPRYDALKAEMLDRWHKKYNLKAPMVTKYTNTENNSTCQKHDKMFSRDIEVDVVLPKFTFTIPEITKVNEVDEHDDEGMYFIPGFETPTPTLEFNMLNGNQVIINEPISDVTVQFDVIDISDSTLKAKSSFACLPMKTGQERSKMLKCTKTIQNSALPAEICNIASKLLRDQVLN